MLSPSNRVVLLPCDREIIELAGITETEYREFVRRCKFESKIRPELPTAVIDPVTLAIGSIVLGAGLFAAGTLLAPKPKTQQSGSAKIISEEKRGQDIVTGDRYAPKAGFDSLQNVVELGSTVPLVYAKREVIEGVSYGGIRINTNLLWAQVLSLGGDQLFRGIYLIGEGDSRTDSMELDAEQFALGNNLLGNYVLEQNDTSRVSIYYSNDGGRIQPTDHIAGRKPNSDPGRAPGEDVFAVRGAGGTYGPNFSYSFKPTTQTSFGLFNWIGNGMCFRVNPKLRPQYRVATRPKGDGSTVRVVCDDDSQANVERQKQGFRFSGQSGITSGNVALIEGDVVTYQLSAAASYTGDFTHTSTANFGQKTAELSANDVNQAVASRQKQFDQNIVLGELYKIGSALCTCTFRTPAVFASAADGGNQQVTAEFTCVRPGTMSSPPGMLGTSNATLTSQIFRLARGSFVTEYPTEVLEIGIRSTVGIQVNGLTNTIEGGFDYSNIDAKACPAPPAFGTEFPEIPADWTVATQQYNAGSVNTVEERFSYFRLMYRAAGTDDEFKTLSNLFGIRSETNLATYNYIRLEMPEIKRYEFLIEPISGWEVRSFDAANTQRILDHRITGESSVVDNGVTVRYRGYSTGGNINSYRMKWVDPIETSLEWDNQSMADSYARVAEAFCYDEIQTTVDGSPEHEIVYINTILPNNVAPQYDDLALVGMNIRASREFSNLSQFSVYMNRGLGGFHDFPSVLKDILTNERYGAGEIISPSQIDTASFAAATAFTNSRNYYFDGTISSPINIRLWASQVARNFLLDLIVRNGKWSLEPIVVFDKPEPITGLFTAGNIIEDSFELSYLDQDQRQPPRVSVKWRQEQTGGDVDNSGLFPIIREVTVREKSTPIDAPIESIDISNYATSQKHAIDLGKFECRFRRLSTHQVQFKTTVDQAALELGKCFKLGLETLSYDQPANGYISESGEVTSWPELADGKYAVLTWNGQSNSLQETTIEVINGKSTTARGAVFCRQDSTTVTQTYKVTALAFDEEGNLDVEAIHWPTDSNGVSLLTKDFEVTTEFQVDGKV